MNRRIALCCCFELLQFGCLILDPVNASEYREFLAEYEALGHMTKNPPTKMMKPEQTYYIPHHAILRDISATTR